ncbi:MAG: hypothetical protein JW837_05295 [Sedimentisphaerales bacterium]|nr:hypothetical protein [Sedimentisphaerales bacterium]
MEPNMNSEQFSPPSENPGPSNTNLQSEPKSFFEQECLQQTWLNVKLATWIKCIIVIAVLIAAAAFIGPKIGKAQSAGQKSELTGYQYEEGSWCNSGERFRD